MTLDDAVEIVEPELFKWVYRIFQYDTPVWLFKINGRGWVVLGGAVPDDGRITLVLSYPLGSRLAELLFDRMSTTT